MKTDLTILIPCLNEKKTILTAVQQARNAGKKSGLSYEVIVADCGSEDGTLRILKKYKFCTVVNVPIAGYGAALHWGILTANGKYVFFADADLSYDFSELSNFKKFIDKYDLVLGSRLNGKIEKNSMPFVNRYLGTPLLTFLIRLSCGIYVTDCNSGMRLVKKRFYKKLNMKNSGMEWASELLIRTSIVGGMYREVPISFYKDQRDKKPHLVRWIDGWRHLKAIVLLKPKILLPPISLFLLFIFLPLSTDLWFFSISAFIFLVLTFVTANVLNMAELESNWLTKKRINCYPVISLAIFLNLSIILILIFPINQLTEMVMIALVMIYNMWVFLIETIKTHLVNRMPEKLQQL